MSAEMASRNVKYVVREKGGPLEAQYAGKPTNIAANELCIEVKAVAVNQADYKMTDLGHRVQAWPLIAGLDGAGVVDAVGESVEGFGVGDRVVAMFSIGGEGGSFQKFALTQDSMVARIPQGLSFEDAASLTVSFYTAIAALGIGLKSPLPFLEGGAKDCSAPSSVLILGGSSSLGSATIQLLRLSLPSCRILTTSSLKHTERLLALGVDEVIDRSSPSLAADVKAAVAGGRGVAAIIDSVGAGSTQRDVFDAFDPSGPKQYAQVWTGDEEIAVPEGVDSVLFRSRDVSQIQGGGNVMQGLQKLLAEGNYRLPVPVRHAGRGIDGLKAALDLTRKGLSGEKAVVALD